MSELLEVNDNLAVRYRPKSIHDIIGNKGTTSGIAGYFKAKKLVKTWMFAGSPGGGKTTLARIVAKTINCQALKNITPCGECESCKLGITIHPDIHEFNCSVNRKIDDIRGVIQRSKNSPRNNYTVFIMDEVQGLAPQAVQALLKPIEEPPPRTIWILCTTEPEKLPPAIRSRCTTYYLNYPLPEAVGKRLQTVCKKEYGNKVAKTLKPFCKNIAISCNCQPRSSLIMLEKIVMSITNEKTSDKKEIKKLIETNIVGSGDLDIIVMKFLLALYKLKIKKAIEIIGVIDKSRTDEFLSLAHSYSYYTTLVLSDSDKSIRHKYWGVNKIQWENKLSKVSIPDFRIPLTACSIITDATEKLRTGLVSHHQTLVQMLYNYFEIFDE
jgi:DNA polymerase III subunit gamma/tau